jgi:hypothetical protein
LRRRTLRVRRFRAPRVGLAPAPHTRNGTTPRYAASCPPQSISRPASPRAQTRAISITSHRSLGNISRVTNAAIGNSKVKSGVRYRSSSGCRIDRGTIVHNEAMQARTRLSIVVELTAPPGADHAGHGEAGPVERKARHCANGVTVGRCLRATRGAYPVQPELPGPLRPAPERTPCSATNSGPIPRLR